jgi:hypothetical protein
MSAKDSNYQTVQKQNFSASQQPQQYPVYYNTFHQMSDQTQPYTPYQFPQVIPVQQSQVPTSYPQYIYTYPNTPYIPVMYSYPIVSQTPAYSVPSTQENTLAQETLGNTTSQEQQPKQVMQQIVDTVKLQQILQRLVHDVLIQVLNQIDPTVLHQVLPVVFPQVLGEVLPHVLPQVVNTTYSSEQIR